VACDSAYLQDAVRAGGSDEVIVSTLPCKVSKWLRRDLIRRTKAWAYRSLPSYPTTA
jgi:hypothetical protein